MIHQPITAQQGYGEYRPTCDDCGGTAAGQGPFYNRPYCRLCERNIADTYLTQVWVSADRTKVAA